MPKIRDLPLVPAVARRWFAEAGLCTSDDVWREVGPEFSSGLRAVERKTGIVRDVAHQALLTAAAAEPRLKLTRFELLLAAASLSLLALVGLRIAEGLGWLRFPVAGLTVACEQAVVVPRDGLPAFHVLTEQDLHSEARPRTMNGVTSKIAVGRYLLHPLAGGAVVREDDLGTVGLPAALLAGRRIATLKTDPVTLGAQVAPGAQVIVVLTPQGPGTKAAEAEATILAVDRKTGQVAVAFTASPSPEVLGALGAPASFLVQAGAPQQTAAAKP
ncbi:MAG TPA: hypothetical protein VGE98_13440 [Thermoanaerobaculia bacterium]